jgi:3-oxoadipate CoA-transferase, beta subunit
MTTQPLNPLQIAWRTAQDIQEGMLVNLGLGMPVAVADYIRPDVDVFIQSENGVVGVGPLAAPERVDTDLVDAGSRRVTIRSGASIVDSSWSFAMIRGGHVDVAILGAFEVAADGCARSVWVIMEHVTRKGAPRLLASCTLPLTAVRCVKRIYTDMAVVDVTPSGMVVREMLDGLSETDLRARTGAPLAFAPDCRSLATPDIALPD